jgi:hypothetical protein
MFPRPTQDQRIATGFIRAGMSTNEGGTIPAENLAIYATDRVETTSQVWLGLTVGCARCHDHKFDPISTKDFYSMAAFFRNTTQAAMDKNLMDSPPVLRMPRAEDAKRYAASGRDRSRPEGVRPGRGCQPAFEPGQTQDCHVPGSASSSIPPLPTPPTLCATWFPGPSLPGKAAAMHRLARSHLPRASPRLGSWATSSPTALPSAPGSRLATRSTWRSSRRTSRTPRGWDLP